MTMTPADQLELVCKPARAEIIKEMTRRFDELEMQIAVQCKQTQDGLAKIDECLRGNGKPGLKHIVNRHSWLFYVIGSVLTIEFTAASYAAWRLLVK